MDLSPLSARFKPLAEHLDNWVVAVAAVTSATDEAGLKGVNALYSEDACLSPTIENGLRDDATSRIDYFRTFAPGVTDAIWDKPKVTEKHRLNQVILSGNYFFHKGGKWVPAEYSFTFTPEASGSNIDFHTSRIHPQPDGVKMPDTENDLDPSEFSRKLADFFTA